MRDTDHDAATDELVAAALAVGAETGGTLAEAARGLAASWERLREARPGRAPIAAQCGRGTGTEGEP